MTYSLLLLAAPSASHSAASTLYGVADHGPPLLRGGSVEVLAERPALWIRESASAREQNMGISSSIQSARRWPDRVVTSTPGTTPPGSTAAPRARAARMHRECRRDRSARSRRAWPAPQRRGSPRSKKDRHRGRCAAADQPGPSCSSSSAPQGRCVASPQAHGCRIRSSRINRSSLRHLLSPDPLEDRPLLGMVLDVPLEARGELPDAGADVSVAIARRHELERLFDPGEEETVLAPRECGNEGRACAERQGDLRRGEQSRPSEELDRFAHARDRTVREDPEHTALADHPMDAERRIDGHEHEALRLPRPID